MELPAYDGVDLRMGELIAANRQVRFRAGSGLAGELPARAGSSLSRSAVQLVGAAKHLAGELAGAPRAGRHTQPAGRSSHTEPRQRRDAGRCKIGDSQPGRRAVDGCRWLTRGRRRPSLAAADPPSQAGRLEAFSPRPLGFPGACRTRPRRCPLPFP